MADERRARSADTPSTCPLGERPERAPLRATEDTLFTDPIEGVAPLRDLRITGELGELRRRVASGDMNGAEPEIEEVNGFKFTSRVLEDVPAKDLKPLADTLKQRIGSGVVAVVAVSDGKASLVVGVTDDLTDRISAVDLVRQGSQALGGKGGGGRPDMAQAGGPDGSAAGAAISAIQSALSS